MQLRLNEICWAKVRIMSLASEFLPCWLWSACCKTWRHWFFSGNWPEDSCNGKCQRTELQANCLSPYNSGSYAVHTHLNTQNHPPGSRLTQIIPCVDLHVIIKDILHPAESLSFILCLQDCLCHACSPTLRSLKWHKICFVLTCLCPKWHTYLWKIGVSEQVHQVWEKGRILFL